tara:strand:- start:126 stop:626 length:501 start_codon:yes stop_codon:yes gene_type:complete
MKNKISIILTSILFLSSIYLVKAQDTDQISETFYKYNPDQDDKSDDGTFYKYTSNSGWSNDLFKECKDSVKNAMKDEDMSQMEEFLGVKLPSKEEISDCSCNLFAELYPEVESFEELDILLSGNMPDEDMQRRMMECFGDDFIDMLNEMEGVPEEPSDDVEEDYDW